MNVWLVLTLLVSHWIGDFLLQNNWMAMNKSKMLSLYVICNVFFNINNIEVHIFPLEDAIVKTANDFLEENREDIEIKKLNKQEKERKRQENNLKWKNINKPI